MKTTGLKLLSWVPLLFLFLSLVIRVDYRLDAPGNLQRLDTFIRFEDTPLPQARLDAVYVMSYNRPTMFQWALAQFVPSVDVTPLPPAARAITNTDLFVSGQISRNSAIEASVLTAFLALDYEVAYEIKWLLSLYRIEQAGNGLVIGRALATVNGHPDQLMERLNAVPCGETVALTFEEDEDTIITLSKTVDGCVLGLTFQRFYAITEFPIAYTVETSLIGGPSSGMMQTLYIYAMLTGLDFGGLHVAGTGTIFIDGTVGPIGAVRQKVYTAHRENADVFFVPSGSNYTDALAVYESLRNPSFDLVEVRHFNDILDYLEGRHE